MAKIIDFEIGNKMRKRFSRRDSDGRVRASAAHQEQVTWTTAALLASDFGGLYLPSGKWHTEPIEINREKRATIVFADAKKKHVIIVNIFSMVPHISCNRTIKCI